MLAPRLVKQDKTQTMKALILTFALTVGGYAATAQNPVKRDTTHLIVNPDVLRADSVKRGQEVYLPGKNKPDTTSQKQRRKDQSTPPKKATRPR